jgi:hypothetical protein
MTDLRLGCQLIRDDLRLGCQPIGDDQCLGCQPIRDDIPEGCAVYPFHPAPEAGHENLMGSARRLTEGGKIICRLQTGCVAIVALDTLVYVGESMLIF